MREGLCADGLSASCHMGSWRAPFIDFFMLSLRRCWDCSLVEGTPKADSPSPHHCIEKLFADKIYLVL